MSLGTEPLPDRLGLVEDLTAENCSVLATQSTEHVRLCFACSRDHTVMLETRTSRG
jgi:hypothetical protein